MSVLQENIEGMLFNTHSEIFLGILFYLKNILHVQVFF